MKTSGNRALALFRSLGFCTVFVIFAVALDSALTWAADGVDGNDKYTKNTLMKVVMDDPKANEVMVKHAPDLMSNPQIDMARDMSIAEVATYPEAGLSEETVAAILTDLNKLD